MMNHHHLPLQLVHKLAIMLSYLDQLSHLQIHLDQLSHPQIHLDQSLHPQIHLDQSPDLQRHPHPDAHQVFSTSISSARLARREALLNTPIQLLPFANIVPHPNLDLLQIFLYIHLQKVQINYIFPLHFVNFPSATPHKGLLHFLNATISSPT